MIFSVHQPQYIPWLGYFDKIAKSDCFVFLDNVQYKTREFQNRNKIRTKDGWIWLSVPVACKGKRCQIMSDVLIDNNFLWQRQHLKSLKTWYAKAEFTKYHMPFLEDVYSKRWDKLSELNVSIIIYALEKLEISKDIRFESRLGTTQKSTDRIIEIAKKLRADCYLSGTGGRDYLEEDKFVKEDIKLVYQDFKHPVYRQQFMSGKDDFIPYMSILDLLFNEGPRAKEILGL